MKQIIIVIAVIACIVLAIFIFNNSNNEAEISSDSEVNTELQNSNQETEYGFSYGYASGLQGYTVVTPPDATQKDLVFTQSIFSTQAYRSVTPNSEYPPALLIEVFRNPMNLDLTTWIQENDRSNFSLSIDGVMQSKSLGSANYTTYTYDGLYRTDVYAYAQEGYVYLLSNMWADGESVMKKDMEEIVASIIWSKPAIDASVAHGDIKVTAPTQRQGIESPLQMSGLARGTWFFEGSFPVTLVDWNGLIIAEGYAQAEGEWMTEDFVPWTSQITFTKPSFDERGYLILQKDNPSGLPENDDSIQIPILFQ